MPTLLLLGDDDEYVPPEVDKAGLLTLWSGAIGGVCEAHLIPEARHYMGTKEEEAEAVIGLILPWLEGIQVPASPIARRASLTEE